MSPIVRRYAVVCLALALAACSGDDRGAARQAEGQILEGSASDAMLPLDTVRSQAPLAPHEGSAADKAKAAESSDAAATDAPAAVAPADEPAAEAEPAN